MSTRQRRRAQSGAASAMLAVVTPVVLVLLTLLFQLVAWQQADHIAHLAARRGADAARLLGGTDSAGRQQATDTLAQLGPDLLTGAEVVVTKQGSTVSAEVSGEAISLIPWLHLPVHERAQGTVEQFVGPGAQP